MANEFFGFSPESFEQFVRALALFVFGPGVLWELLRDGARQLDPKTIYEQETVLSGATEERFPTRYVLLGGPGSGKSTVGQLLA